MKTQREIRKELQQHVGAALYPLVEEIIMKAYNLGYVDAVNIYQKAIDLKGLRETWDNGN